MSRRRVVDTSSITLGKILDDGLLEPHFQPIVDLASSQTLGYEALIRGPKGSRYHSPNALFSAAIEQGLHHELEIACRRATIESYAHLRPYGKLFLNITASLLSSPKHQTGFTAELLAELGISQSDIVIELSEQHPFDNYGLTTSAVEHYRRMGFTVAVDDLGSGYSGLKLWSELRPEYVKIDQHFVHRCDRDPVKREFIRSLVNISQSMNCHVIAEGIETDQELQVIQQLGVDLGQGFYIGRPTALPDLNYRQVCERVVESTLVPVQNSQASGATAASIVSRVPVLKPDERTGIVVDLFRQFPHLSTVPVVENARLQGVVLKSELMELFSTQYGRALYEQKPVKKVMSNSVLIFESETSLEFVSSVITDDDAFTLEQDIVIVQDGEYLGMGRVRDLLKRITEQKIQNAQYSNPLTMLPGNVPIDKETDRLLAAKEEFYVAYFDLNNFKPYNDCYGYAKGDQVIRFLGDIIRQYASHKDNFIGHIGGDDFVVIYRAEDWEESCHKIVSEFDQAVSQYYVAEDVERGGIEALDRQGERRTFGLLGLAVGVVHPNPELCSNHNQIAEMAAQAKKVAKDAVGSRVFISRRRSLQGRVNKQF